MEYYIKMTHDILFLKVDDIIVENIRKCNEILHDSEYAYYSLMKHKK